MAIPHCFFLLTLLLATSTYAADQPTQELIDKICRQMEEYEFCNKVFNDNLGSLSGNLVSLTGMTIDQVLKNASNTQAFIADVLKDVTDFSMRIALMTCEGGYNQVKVSFEDAKRSFEGGKYDDMNKAEAITPRAQASCDITFSTPPNPVNPLVDMNRQMKILVAMAVVTGHTLSP